MKLIKQSFEFINQTDFSLVGIKKHIEKCARVSYKSEDKITDTSYEKFVNMLESRGHNRPLEFGTVYLKVTNKEAFSLKYKKNPYSKVALEYPEGDIPNIYCIPTHFITTNYRVIKENHWENDLQYLCEPTEYHYKRYTAHMILDRGVMDEFRTHVGLSHLAESTRYCNYSKDKFDNEITFIKPCWLDDEKLKLYGPYHTVIRDKSPESIFIANLNNVERDYLDLIKLGWTPQQARSILPLGIKSELISCGFEDAWNNFFYRRDAPDAHPMAQEIAKPMHQKFIELTEMK